MLDECLRGTNTIVVETFDYNCHVFNLVNDNDKFYIQYEKDLRLISKLVIKPDLWVFYKDGGYEHGVNLLKPLNLKAKKVLASEFYIDPDIFDYLISNELISYSKAMADLYDFEPEYSRDYNYHRRDYKHKKNKDVVLKKLRLGQFN